VTTGRFGAIIAALGLVLLAQCAGQVSVGPVIDPGIYPRLTVLPFKTESIFSTIGHQIADEIVVELVEKAPDFHVVERSRVDALLFEQNLEERGGETRDPLLEAARLLGVDAILTGSVSLSIQDIDNAPERAERKAEGVAVVRLIDAKDGRIIWAKRVESDYATLTSLYGDIYVSQTDHDLVQEVVREIAHLVASYFYPRSEREGSRG
jgi:curli biogenesis system outer membrane secretion channel CsgG